MNFQSLFVFAVVSVFSASSCLFFGGADDDNTDNGNNKINNLGNNSNNGSNNKANNGSNNLNRPFCGDGLINNVEECDGTTIDPMDSCASVVGPSSVGELTCNSCTLNVDNCSESTFCGTERSECQPDSPPPTCGDGYRGIQTCGDNCRLDRSGCIPTYDQIAAGRTHTCGLRKDGRVQCWGDDQLRQLTPPEGIRFSQISAGTWHTCGIADDDTHTVYCWGGEDDESNAPSGSFRSVSAGHKYSCAISDNDVAECWGQVPDDVNFLDSLKPISISAGKTHVCVVYLTNQLNATGPVYSLECTGTGEGIRNEVLWNARAISAGDSYNCYIEGNDYLTCADRRAQDDKPTVVTDYPKVQFTEIDTGGKIACGIVKADGVAACWGHETFLQPPPDLVMEKISVGEAHACALDEFGIAYCWGGDPAEDYGQTVVPYD